MKNSTRLVPVLAILLCVSLSCSFLKGRSGNSPYGVKVTDISPVTSIDPKAEFPALSTDTINALIMETPELAKHRDKILDLERAAVNGLVADSRAETQARTINTDDPNFLPVGNETSSKRNDTFIESINLLPAAYAADDARLRCRTWVESNILLLAIRVVSLRLILKKRALKIAARARLTRQRTITVRSSLFKPFPLTATGRSVLK